MFEVWTWRQLGYHDKPIGLLNTAGYYDNLLTFLASSVQSGFMGEWQMELIESHADASILLPHLVETAGTASDAQPLRTVI
ncbi:LOG family protein YvdD [compost metagenome]